MSERESRPATDGVTGAPRSDADLVMLLKEGDESALEALYDRYGRQAYSLSRRIIGDEQLCQDVVQEVFLTLWRDSSRYDGQRGGFGSWLLAMTHHKSVDVVRREENQRRRRADLDEVLQERSPDREVPDEVWRTVRGEQVRRALGDLPHPQREALALAYFAGYTQREIASYTGVPLGTVKTRMLAGVRRLQRTLTRRDEDQ